MAEIQTIAGPAVATKAIIDDRWYRQLHDARVLGTVLRRLFWTGLAVRIRGRAQPPTR
jgi:hypothetical protein